jgi:signal transduction histidine kinase/sugar lactone lactonase YvrE
VWAQYHVDRWTTEEGLPQNTVTSIVQTRDGYLWLGTFGGLVRFDGARFTIFNSANTPQLKSNRITALLEDRDGNLWIGAETGELARYRNGEFAVWPGVGSTILTFYQARNGLIWGLRMAARPIRFSPEQPERAAIVTAAQGLEGERLYSLCEDRAGQLWATTKQGLTVWRDGAFRADHGIEGLPRRGLPRIAPHPDGGLWLVEEKGLGRIVNQRFGLLVETADVMGVPPPPLIETRRGEIWFGYREDRLWRGAREGNFSELKLREAQPNWIRVILEDREGNLWLGSVGGGLLRLRPNRVTTLSKADGLTADETYPIIEDSQGDVWILQGDGYLHRLSAGKLTSWAGTEWKMIQTAFLTTLYRDESGTVWLGGNGAIAQFRDGTFVAQQFKELNSSVLAILKDSQGRMWLGLNGPDLALCQNGVVTQRYGSADGLANGRINVLLEDRAGVLWIGTQGGLSRFKDSRFTSYTTRDGLSNDHVRALYKDQDDALWVGTYGGGLNRLKDGRIAQITTKQGLFDDVVSRILVDDRDRFWMLGNRGIFYVSRQQLNEVADGRSRAVTGGSYGVADGMLSSEGNGLNQPAGWRMHDGRMWFPTLKGIAIVDPREVATTPPPVVIEAATLDGAAVDVRHTIDLAPGQQNLELRFTALHFGKPEQVRFKYRLEGLAQDWVEVGTHRTANFAHLPPGTYTFRVTAANPDGVWNEESASVRIIARPHFYQTWWFAFLVAMGILGVTFFGFKFRVNQVKRQVERARASQEAFARRLIDSQEQERKRIAAELHDSLGQNLLIIKNWALVGLNTLQADNPAREHLGEISETSSLAIEEVRQIAHNLRPYQLERFGLTKTLEYMLNQLQSSSDIEFITELDDLDALLSPESEINFYRIVQECLNNVIKHSDARQCHLSIKRTPSGAEITCWDDGRGFTISAVAASPKSGMGLTGLSERVRMLGGSCSVQSAPGEGTRIFISIDRSAP